MPAATPTHVLGDRYEQSAGSQHREAGGVHRRHCRRAPSGIAKRDYRYSRDRANLAHVRPDELFNAFASILTACAGYLRPGGIAAMTARPWRRDGALVDLPAAVTAAAGQAGLVVFERNVTLLAGLRDERLVPRTSFFHLTQVRQSRARGVPLRVIAREDVLIFRKAASS